jgi:hypothetical protein
MPQHIRMVTNIPDDERVWYQVCQMAKSVYHKRHYWNTADDPRIRYCEGYRKAADVWLPAKFTGGSACCGCSTAELKCSVCTHVFEVHWECTTDDLKVFLAHLESHGEARDG